MAHEKNALLPLQAGGDVQLHRVSERATAPPRRLLAAGAWSRMLGWLG